MTFINIYVKKGKVLHNYMHWKTIMKIMNKNLYFFKGKSKEFIFIDLDDKKIISSQNCFSLMDLDEKAITSIRKNFDYKEV